ncbi:MAG: hypothetical protein M1825_005779 [Sarcosagium campestre]|nr:MAG: hypothetical protein M1825_005779 [Sarcosagium campestre]
MHSTVVRIQNVFGFFTTVACVVAAAVSLSVVFFPQTPSADISIRNIQVVKGRASPYATKREDYAHIRFDLDADLTSLFTWNTKQLFIYVTATYPSHLPNSPPTTAVIWDRIIPSRPGSTKKTTSKKDVEANSPPPGKITLRNVRPKYPISDASGVLAARPNASLALEWNVQPWVGALQWTGVANTLGPAAPKWLALRGGKSEQFDFPEIKVKNKPTGDAQGHGQGQGQGRARG